MDDVVRSNKELSQEQQQAIVTLKNQGYSYKRIHKTLKVAKSSCVKYYKLWEKHEHARKLTMDNRLDLQRLESHLANMAEELMRDQSIIDTITAEDLAKDPKAYTPHTRASVRRSNMNALRETHTMLSHTPSLEGPPEELDLVGTLTTLMDELADTPEKRRKALDIIKEQRQKAEAEAVNS